MHTARSGIYVLIAPWRLAVPFSAFAAVCERALLGGPNHRRQGQIHLVTTSPRASHVHKPSAVWPQTEIDCLACYTQRRLYAPCWDAQGEWEGRSCSFTRAIRLTALDGDSHDDRVGEWICGGDGYLYLFLWRAGTTTDGGVDGVWPVHRRCEAAIGRAMPHGVDVVR